MDLRMPRRKPPSLAISVAYRIVRAGRRLVGAKLLLRFFLDVAWLSWRFAFELAGDVFGSAFQTEARGISEELLREHIRPGAAVLDAGCGPGCWTRIAARHAVHVVGVDSSPEKIAEARRATTETNVEYIAGDVRDTRRHFDVALLIHVLEHVDDAEEFLRTMAAAADVLIIEVPNFEADALNPVRHALGLRYYNDADHVREYTPETLRDELLRSGLAILRLEQNRGSIVAVAQLPASMR